MHSLRSKAGHYCTVPTRICTIPHLQLGLQPTCTLDLWDVADFWDIARRDREDLTTEDATDAQHAAPADQVRLRPLGIEPNKVDKRASVMPAEGGTPGPPRCLPRCPTPCVSTVANTEHRTCKVHHATRPKW